jgi:hypothetical protein
MGNPDAAPGENGFGATISSSSREGLWDGDEDVATPFHKGSVEMCPDTGGVAHHLVGLIW